MLPETMASSCKSYISMLRNLLRNCLDPTVILSQLIKLLVKLRLLSVTQHPAIKRLTSKSSKCYVRFGPARRKMEARSRSAILMSLVSYLRKISSDSCHVAPFIEPLRPNEANDASFYIRLYISDYMS